MSATITLYTGGSRSGKSRLALEHALRFQHRVFLATATPFDEEMRKRIEAHQAERGRQFHTLEESRDLAAAMHRIPAGTEVLLVDCLTVWLGNLMHVNGADKLWHPEIDRWLAVLKAPPVHLVLVTNEVGMGLVPETAMGRRFRDIQGSLNQKVAALADTVVLVACGMPLVLKGRLPS